MTADCRLARRATERTEPKSRGHVQHETVYEEPYSDRRMLRRIVELPYLEASPREAQIARDDPW